MKRIITTITILLLYTTMAMSIEMTVEDMEAESVEGLAPASEEMNQELNQNTQKHKISSELEEEVELEMVNGVIQRKIRIDEDSVIIGEDDVEDAKNLEPVAEIQI